MESKDFPTIVIRCILCCRLNDPNIVFLDIDNELMPNSKKTVKSVVIHLSKCIKKDYNFDFYSCVCSSCFEKLVKYDKIMVRLLAHQKELGHMLEQSMQILNAEENVDVSAGNNVVYKIDLESGQIDNETESFKEEVASVCSSTNDEDETDDDNLSQESTMSSFACGICENEFKTKGALQTHLRSHAKYVSCSICGAARKDEEYLELHMNTHEGKTENECRYCPKKYSRRAHVIRHMHLHWDKKKYQCEKCGLRFSQANILYNHKMNHEAEEQPIICSICDQSFKSKRTFKHHMITHQEDRPMYPCEICGKVFTQKYTIKAHLKTHSDNYETYSNPTKKIKISKKDSKEFACIICDKVLGTKENLHLHMTKEHDVITEPEDNIYIKT